MKKLVQYRKWAAINYSEFSSDVQSRLSDLPDSLDEAVESYNSKVTEVVDKHAPLLSRVFTV